LSIRIHEKPAQRPTFDAFALFIREVVGYPARKAITPETLFENDMGVTGDDGVDLLEATEKRFNADWTDFRTVFNLKPDEYLFHGEGFGLFPLWAIGIGRKPSIRPFTVGELYAVVCRTMRA